MRNQEKSLSRYTVQMRVGVDILTGTFFYVEVENDAKVVDLKREIEAQQKLPQDRLILFLINNGQHHCLNEEEDDASLVDCGVQDGSHIYLFFNPLEDGSSTTHVVFTWPESLWW
ncbi:hypothetical protein Tsubulata_006391 [Turnera subulata]|uniref:Ubiquitin-like domain-containing protein n=1 Tax=Turnera subulata TaxID=218843 RepID=A0A9Q0IWU4_9ROSI|nr:hypothetical protein Tsubulata_006391 [Turnera subulata]